MAKQVAGYSGTPLVKKLGIAPGSSLVLLREPERFRALLAGMPDEVRISTRAIDGADLTIWFVTRRGEVETGMPERARAMGQGLWVAWPKKTSGVKSDLTEDIIRNAGLAHGLVDYKVCAISEIWSGLKFARRKK